MGAMPTRVCSTAPRPTYAFKARSLPLCTDIADPPDAAPVPAAMRIPLPRPVAMRFGCFLPMTSVDVSRGEAVSMETLAKPVADDPCIFNLHTRLKLPWYVFATDMFELTDLIRRIILLKAGNGYAISDAGITHVVEGEDDKVFADTEVLVCIDGVEQLIRVLAHVPDPPVLPP